MSDSLHTPHKHEHGHDHDHDHDHGDETHPVHDHGHGDSCCSGTPAPTLVKLGGTTAGSRLSTFRIEAMDCPTEQTLIQNKLGKLAGVQQLEFNLINRILGVTHDLPNTAPIIEAVKSRDAGRPCRKGTPARTARQEALVAAGVSGVGALGAEVLHFTNAAPTWVIAMVALVSILSGGLTTYKGLDRPEEPQPEHQCADEHRGHRRRLDRPVAGSGDGDVPVHRGRTDRSQVPGPRAMPSVA
jgi:Cd2+/Zn2+-exporting ATPase